MDVTVAVTAAIAVNATGAVTTQAASTIGVAVATAIADSTTSNLELLATDVPTVQRGVLVHNLYTDLNKIVVPSVIEVAVKAAARAALEA